VKRAAVYLDSSALLKLVFEEDESRELWRFLRRFPIRFSSIIAHIEVLRVARQVSDDVVAQHARDVLAHTNLIELHPPTVSRAVELRPPNLRALDAIHLATALSLEPDADGMVVYDRRLADAARKAGLTVWAPA
jgi:uncharacterized protein